MRLPALDDIGGQSTARWGPYAVTREHPLHALRNVVLWRLFGWNPATVDNTFHWLFTPVSPRSAIICWSLIALESVALAGLYAIAVARS